MDLELYEAVDGKNNGARRAVRADHAASSLSSI